MEHSSASLPSATRLLRRSTVHVEEYGYLDNVSCQCPGPRARHGMHHQEVKRLRFFCTNDATANHHGTTFEDDQGQKIAQCKYLHQRSGLEEG